VPPSPPSHWRGGAGQAHRRWKMCDGWPAGPAPCRFLQPIPTSRDRTRRSIPRFAHESDEISKAVYQALPLCIVAALQGYAEAYATIIAYGTPTSGYWRKSALVATTAS
jgi:hypothetical protein